MKISENGIQLLKQFEGCKLTAYKDSVGIWNIGYGTTNGDKAITGVTICEGLKITQKDADNWLEKTVNQKYAKKVMMYDSIYHWNQNQFDALCCFAYNIGSIDQLVQTGSRSIKEISEKFLAHNKAGGKELPGLTKRRRAEKALFDTPC
jgi:GH24 family phage-related lysozyme (muramidase)